LSRLRETFTESFNRERRISLTWNAFRRSIAGVRVALTATTVRRSRPKIFGALARQRMSGPPATRPWAAHWPDRARCPL